MDFLKSASLLIPALSGIPITNWPEPDSPENLADFEKKYCFHPAIQIPLTGKYLESFFYSKNQRTLYHIKDRLDTHLVIFSAFNLWIILGPYVETPWQDGQMKTLLASQGLAVDMFVPYKLYRCQLPIAATSKVIHTATILIENTVGNSPPFVLKEISTFDSKIQLELLENNTEITAVQKRYEIENAFMAAIRHGQTKKAIDLYHQLSALSVGLSFISDEITNHVAGAAIIRTLIRKAAESAGLSPLLVDTISQEYAQQMHQAVSRQQLMVLQEGMISRFCNAVRKNQERSYSFSVQKVIQYIDINLSKSLPVTELAAVAGLSKPYLARQFHKEAGVTINQYIAGERIKKAAELLRNSNLSVQEISAYVGYLDNNYFAKVFKSQIGISPSEYRKKYTI